MTLERVIKPFGEAHGLVRRNHSVKRNILDSSLNIPEASRLNVYLQLSVETVKAPIWTRSLIQAIYLADIGLLTGMAEKNDTAVRTFLYELHAHLLTQRPGEVLDLIEGWHT